MFLSLCPSCHHRDAQVEQGEFPRGAVTCPNCGAPYAPIHAADVRFALLEDWAPREGVAFDDEGPIEKADAERFEAYLADGYWFVTIYSREAKSGDQQFHFETLHPRSAADPHRFMTKTLVEDAYEVRTRSKRVASTSIENDGDRFTLTTTFLGRKAAQTDTYYLVKGF